MNMFKMHVGKRLLAGVNFVLWKWQNFVGMCMDKFVDMGMKF